MADNVQRAEERSHHLGNTASPSTLVGPSTPQTFSRPSARSPAFAPEGRRVLHSTGIQPASLLTRVTEASAHTALVSCHWGLLCSGQGNKAHGGPSLDPESGSVQLTDGETEAGRGRAWIRTGTRELSAKHLPSTPHPGRAASLFLSPRAPLLLSSSESFPLTNLSVFEAGKARRLSATRTNRRPHSGLGA